MSKFRILARVEPDGLPFEVKGREAWALENLVQAGNRGCTPIDHPGPRWSAYVHKLRHKRGLVIETVDEGHDGPFAGTHARYVIHSQVTVLQKEGRAA
jgi:hypothetical protein